MGSDDNKKKKQLGIVGGSFVVLVAMVVAVTIGVSHRGRNTQPTPADQPSNDLQASVKSIQSICQPTQFKQTCETSLSAVAGNTTDSKELLHAVFDLAINSIGRVLNHSGVLLAAEKDPRTSGALEICNEVLGYAIDDLNRTLDQVAAVSLATIDRAVEDMKVWLSSALTYQDTCLDGFENTTGDAGEAMRQVTNASIELTANTLAIINQMSSSGSPSRRLLSSSEDDDKESRHWLPAWVKDGKESLVTAPLSSITPNLTVAQDGSGDFKTIAQAVFRAPNNSKETFVIYVKAGVYKEKVWVKKAMKNVMIYGDGPTKTKITGSLNNVDKVGTYHTASMAVDGDGFIGRELWIENSAGPAKGMAVALRVDSDYSIFYNCRMEAYQDTMYAHTRRNLFLDCTISGTIDFIFGNANSLFQNCLILVRRPMAHQVNAVTAQGRKFDYDSTAIVLHNCTIEADSTLAPLLDQFPSFLGRPWKQYSRTIVMQSSLGDVIDPKGWLPWNSFDTFAQDTCYYSEFDNRGPGANTSLRVKWPCIRQINYDKANMFAPINFLNSKVWLQEAHLPFTPGLFPLPN